MIHDPLPWPLVADDDRHPRAEPIGAEPDLVEEANRTAGLCVLGLVVGILVTKLFDLATAGPGLRVMVGL